MTLDASSTETGMSFETVALFTGSSLIKFKTSFLETLSKETFPLPKFSFIFYSFLYFQNLVIFAIHSLKVLEIFLLCTEIFFFFPVKIILLLVLHLSVKKGLTVSQDVQLFHLCLDFQRKFFQLTSVYSNRLLRKKCPYSVILVRIFPYSD